MGSPATTYVFNQKFNNTYDDNYEITRIKEFYTIGHLVSDFSNIKFFFDTHELSEEYKEFLNWNHTNNGFWGKVKKVQPEILLFDLFSDIYFGDLVLENGTHITRNIRLNKHKIIDTKRKTFNDDNFFESLFTNMQLFINKIKNLSPNTQIVFNSIRFPEKMSINGIPQKSYDADVYKLTPEKIKNYNNAFQKLDDLIEKKMGINKVNFDMENDFSELNFANKKNWYYFYNQNYYTDVQTQIEKIAQNWKLGPTVTTINQNEKLPEVITSNVILLDMSPDKPNLNYLSRNKVAYNKVKQLLKADYILHGGVGNAFRFVKRNQVKSIYPKFKDLHYRLILPKDKKEYGPNRLLVRMLSYTNQNALSIFDRNFQEDFQSLKSSVIKNTYILEIGDINLISGSFYTNTDNFPDYQQQISELIKFIADKYNVSSNRIVMYGASRGATGALLNGALNDYKIVATDPVIDGQAWFNMNDRHFTAGIRKVNLIDDISYALKNYTLSKDNAFIIGDSKVGVTFLPNMQLPSNKISKIDVNMDIFEHASLNSKSVPIQLSLINYLLIKEDINVRDNLDEVPEGVVVEVKHLADKSINLEYVSKFRIRQVDLLKNPKFDTKDIKNFVMKFQDNVYQYWIKN